METTDDASLHFGCSFVTGAQVHRGHVAKVIHEVLLAGSIEEAIVATGYPDAFRRDVVVNVVFNERRSLVALDHSAVLHKTWSEVRGRAISLLKLAIVVAIDNHNIVLLIF